jgi:hypothetical protein
MHSTIEGERTHVRAHTCAIVAPLVARGLRAIPEPIADPATEQVARAFPHCKTMRAVSVFTVLKRCASRRLRRAVDAGVITPKLAYELCFLDVRGQDVVVALGGIAAGYAAREIARIRRRSTMTTGGNDESKAGESKAAIHERRSPSHRRHDSCRAGPSQARRLRRAVCTRFSDS